MAGSSLSTRVAAAPANSSSAVATSDALPRRFTIAPISAPSAATWSRGTPALTCSSSRIPGSSANARPSRRRTRSAGSSCATGRAQARSGIPTSAARPTARIRTSSGGGSMSSVNGIDRFCTTVSASSSTARWLTMPKRSTRASQSRAGVDGRRGPAEHPHLAPIRQRRAGDEVDQHLRGHLVQPQDGELFARVQRERLNTKRPQAAIVLGNSRQLDDGRWRHAHAPSRPLTSSTIRDDSVRAANSTLIAAKLQAIAP